MSVTDVASRIQQIQNQLTVYATGAAATGSTSTTSTDFAASLDSLLGGVLGDDGTSSSSSGALAQQAVVADAQKYLGIPYVWGGSDPETGLDCSGLVQQVYGDLGYSLPRHSSDQAKQGTAVASLAQAQPGDLLAFGSPVDHVAIYLGDGKMIEAPHTGANVRVSDVWSTPTAIRRIVSSNATSSVSATSGLGSSYAAAARQLLAAQQAYAQAYGVPSGYGTTSNAGSASYLGSLLGSATLGNQ